MIMSRKGRTHTSNSIGVFGSKNSVGPYEGVIGVRGRQKLAPSELASSLQFGGYSTSVSFMFQPVSQSASQLVSHLN